MKVEGDDDQRDEAARLAARGIAALEALAARLDMIASVAAVALQAHAALERIDELTGQTSNDTILNLIFSSFCIGK